MTIPDVPFYPRHLCVDPETLREFATTRYLLASLQQPRDSQGQFKSHGDVPYNESKER